MTFSEYMANLRISNPGLNDSTKITIKVDQFEAQLKRAFDAGYEHRNSLGQTKNPLADVLGMFK